MLVKKAVSNYLVELKKTASQRKFTRQKDCLELFLDYLANYTDCQNAKGLGPEHIREFLSYWYIRKVGWSATHAMDCLRSLKQFVGWLDREQGSNLSTELKEDFQELSQDLPRVFKVMNALDEYESKQRLLEEPFLQKFSKFGEERLKEILGIEGIEPFDTKAIDYDRLEEGYFEVTGIKGGDVEVTSYEGGKPIFPVRFPQEALLWLKEGYVINLSLAPHKKSGYWEILEHGFVYPE